MKKVQRDESREYRIDNEIIVDDYGEEEHAMGWHYYPDDNFDVPFPSKMRC